VFVNVVVDYGKVDVDCDYLVVDFYYFLYGGEE